MSVRAPLLTTAIVFQAFCSSGFAASGVALRDEIDARAFRVFTIFTEACVLGHTGKEGRINTLDSHPMLRRMPIPPESKAAAIGRLIWVAPENVFVVLEPNLNCRSIISDEKLKGRFEKFIENADLGKSGQAGSVKFKESDHLSEKQRDEYKSRNLTIRTYLLRMASSNLGVFLTLEESIAPSPGMYASRLSAAYITFADETGGGK